MLYYLMLATSLPSCNMVLQVSHKSTAGILSLKLFPQHQQVFFPTASIMVRRRRITVYGTGILIQEPNIVNSLFMPRTVLLFGPAIPVSCTLI